MVGSGRFHRRAIGLGGTLVLLGFVCACPSAARAECGDYVIVVRHTDSANPIAEQAPAPARPKCHGPECSAAPTKTVPLPPPSIVERPGLDLATITATPNPAPPSDLRRLAVARLRPSISPSDVFHPPRTV